jgi:multiple sugar transport system substrate-binding protein
MFKNYAQSYIAAKLVKAAAFAITLFLLSGPAFLRAGGAKENRGEPGIVRVWSGMVYSREQYNEIIHYFNGTIGRERNIRIEYTIIGSGYEAVINRAVSSRQEPDIFEVRPADMARWAGEDRLLPLTELPDFEDFLAKNAPYHEQNKTIFDGKIYSIMHHRQYYGLAYNKRLLARAGFEKPPETWAEFEEACTVISALKNGRVFGFAMPLAYPDYPRDCVEFFALPSTGCFFYDPGEGLWHFTEFLPFFRMFLRLKEAGALYPGMETLSLSDMYAQFAEGRIAFIPVDARSASFLQDVFPASMDWGIVPFPLMEKNVQYPTAYYDTPVFAVSVRVKQRGLLREAAEVYRVLHDEQTYRSLYRNGRDFPPNRGITVSETAPERFFSFLNLSPVMVKAPQPPPDVDYREVFTKILMGSDAGAALEGLERQLNF